MSNDVALYVLCYNDTSSSIKIGKVSGGVLALMNQYSTRYYSQGYKLLRYWQGREYYAIETMLHNHQFLLNTDFAIAQQED